MQKFLTWGTCQCSMHWMECWGAPPEIFDSDPAKSSYDRRTITRPCYQASVWCRKLQMSSDLAVRGMPGVNTDSTSLGRISGRQRQHVAGVHGRVRGSNQIWAHKRRFFAFAMMRNIENELAMSAKANKDPGDSSAGVAIWVSFPAYQAKTALTPGCNYCTTSSATGVSTRLYQD